MSNPRAGSAPDGASSLRIGYVLKMFPRLSETFILNEILELERQGAQVSVFSLMLPDDGRFHGRLSELKLTVKNVPRDKPELLWEMMQRLPPELAPPPGAFERCAAFLARHKIPGSLELLLRAVLVAADVKSRGLQHLHAHFATIAARVAYLVHCMTGVPYSFTSHAKDIFRETVDRALYRELAEHAAFNITVSDFNRRYIIDCTPGIDADKVVRLYNGIDLGFFPAPDAEARARVAARARASGAPGLVSVGRLIEKKGFHVLLDALAELRRRGRAYPLSIIGDGEWRSRLEEQCARLGLEAQVRFLGALPQEEVRRVCAEAGMMVLACVADDLGNQDALPTTLLEALALGVPIVSTTIAGIPEIVSHDCGVLCAPGDPLELAGAIDRLAERLGRGELDPTRARARAEKFFDLAHNVRALRERFAASARGAAR